MLISRPKIAVLRALNLGDLLCAVPAFRSLRQALPKAEISLIGLPWSGVFVKRFHHLIDQFFEFPGYPGLPEKDFEISAIDKFINQMRQENFDLIIQMQGDGRVTNPLVQTLGAKLEAGYFRPDGYCPNPDTFMLYSANQHEIKKCLMLMQFLGFKPQGAHLEFPIFPFEERSFEKNMEKWQLRRGDYVIVHPGSQIKERRWPPQKFAKLADYLAGSGYQVVLTGVAEEKEVVLSVVGEMRCPAVNLTGATDLGQLGLLVKNAALLIANDTGVSHIASALKTPSIIISYLKNPYLWAPLNQNLHKVFRADEVDINFVRAQIQSLLNIRTGSSIFSFEAPLSI